MAIYRTKRKKITDALVEKLKEIDGSHPYNINLFQNVKANMVFLDEIEQYPKVCVIAGDETREYLPDNYKWRFLTLSWIALALLTKSPKASKIFSNDSSKVGGPTATLLVSGPLVSLLIGIII